MQRNTVTIALLLIGVCFNFVSSYSAVQDARLIREYKRQLRLNATRFSNNLAHQKVARKLVHQANWAAVSTISTDKAIKNYPMVNVISINDMNISGDSTGHIQFLLTDLDFTGQDWRKDNKVTMLFSDEQLLHCAKAHKDPMEPTCARAIISGHVVKMDKTEADYEDAEKAFIKRHPASKNWLRAHNFYLCKLNITNIYVLDFYGGPHTVSAEEYYNVILDK